MEFYDGDFDGYFQDLHPDLIARVADWFIDRFDVDFHPIENPLAEVIDNSIPFILDDLQNKRPEVLICAARDRLDIFPEGSEWFLGNDTVYPFYQISEPALDQCSGLETNWQASLGLIIAPMGQPFAIRIDTIREASASSTARYRTSVEIIDRYDGENRAEIAFYDSIETLGEETILHGSDERLRVLCMHSALKIGDLELLNAYDKIQSRANGAIERVVRWFRGIR